MKRLLIGGILLGILFAGITKFTLPRSAAFGCFDDCFNYTAGYFITQGKQIYSEFFFNHAPLPAFVSAAILTHGNPINIYELVLQHRQFILLFSGVFALIIVLRFGTKALLVVFGLEALKWYFFGHRFLGESLIVYPIAYLVFYITERQRLEHRIEYLWIGALTYWICFTREPYIPLALCLLFIASWQRKQMLSICTAGIATLVTFLYLPLPDFFFNVVTINAATVAKEAFSQQPVLQTLGSALVYPFLTLGSVGHPVWQAIQLCILLLCVCVLILLRKRIITIAPVVLVILLLVVANVRSTPIGTVYFSAFQLLPWLTVLLVVTAQSIAYLSRSRLLQFGFILFFLFACAWPLVHPSSALRERPSPHEELIINFSEEIQIGNILSHLSTPEDDIFIDGWGELIYWQAQRLSTYRYTWYTSVMPQVEEYSSERKRYLLQTPPQFYYGTCPHEQNDIRRFPEDLTKHYSNIPINGTPSCLWVATNRLNSITPHQWEKAKEFLATPPI